MKSRKSFRTNCPYPKSFKSPAEETIFAMLNTIAIREKVQLRYQKKFGCQSGGNESREEYCEENGIYYNGKEYDWEDSSWSSEDYRVDYAFESEKIKIIVEIDGKKFHQDKNHDTVRDTYLKERGYTVLHFAAKDALRNDLRIKERIESVIKLQQDSNVYTPNALYFTDIA